MTTTTTTTVDPIHQLAELLEICEQFVQASPPASIRLLDELLAVRGITGGSGWLVDVLGLTALRLRAARSGGRR